MVKHKIDWTYPPIKKHKAQSTKEVKVYRSTDVEKRVLHATETLQTFDLIKSPPYRPLLTAYLTNIGLDRVLVAVNEDKEWLEILPGRTKTVGNIGEAKRLEQILYKCDRGKVTSVELEGVF